VLLPVETQRDIEDESRKICKTPGYVAAISRHWLHYYYFYCGKLTWTFHTANQCSNMQLNWDL